MLASEQFESENVSEASDLVITLWLRIHRPNLLHRNRNGRTFVFEEGHQELGRCRLACVATKGVNIVEVFVRPLSGRKSYWLAAIHGHDNTAFQHIDEPVQVVPVSRIMTTWRIFNGKDLDFISWKSCSSFTVSELTLESCAISGHSIYQFQDSPSPEA